MVRHTTYAGVGLTRLAALCSQVARNAFDGRSLRRFWWLPGGSLQQASFASWPDFECSLRRRWPSETVRNRARRNWLHLRFDCWTRGLELRIDRSPLTL